MLPRTPKHDFLAQLHRAIAPKRYLEIGVQTGTSLSVVGPGTAVVGIDPQPMLDPGFAPPNMVVYPVTSDEFFRTVAPGQLAEPVDFAFIDGMHLIENVLDDFANVEACMHPYGVIAIDDVLPYNDEIAHRVPLPGDWAGDVWKLWPILMKWRPDLRLTMIDIAPTGLLVAQRLDPVGGPQLLRAYRQAITDTWAREVPARQWLRHGALQPDAALEQVKGYL